MGEMADFLTDEFDLWGADNDGYIQVTAQHFMGMSDNELRRDTAMARTEKIKSIRRQPSPLSPKQRWCLADWIAKQK